MNGVMMPGVSAGSNQVGASEMWTPQVTVPCAPAAKAAVPGASIPSAARAARRSRRLGLKSTAGGAAAAMRPDLLDMKPSLCAL